MEDVHIGHPRTTNGFRNDGAVQTSVMGPLLLLGCAKRGLREALRMEGYNGFKPACCDSAETNSRTNPLCTPYSPWIQEQANALMAGEVDAPVRFTLTALDSFHRSDTYNPFAKPPVHIPQIRAQSPSGEPRRVWATSVSQALYGVFTAFDTGFVPIAAYSLRCKLNSRQSFWSHGVAPNPDFNRTDGPSRGRPINAAAFRRSLQRSDAASRRRFEALGQPMQMQADTPRPVVGPLWISSYPQFGYLMEGESQVYCVSCTVMKTVLDVPIAAARGFHDCQLLSPAAAMAWIDIDGLRAKASPSGRLFVHGPFGGLDKAAAYFGRSLARQTRTAALLRRR